METYYDPKDLGRFADIGKEAPELAKKFFEYYGAVFAEGDGARGGVQVGAAVGQPTQTRDDAGWRVQDRDGRPGCRGTRRSWQPWGGRFARSS